ncbi:MAG: NAD(P)/FAD-dependent oxidoreductase [Hyphomicrobiales bacterium]
MGNLFDVIVIGGGAAGFMSAIQAGKRGRQTIILERSKKFGEKIRISGGGRCNFTNLYTNKSNFISENPNFVISALSQYSNQDFIGLVKQHNIRFHEKTLGQLFCDESSKLIINMLIEESKKAGVILRHEVNVHEVFKEGELFCVNIGVETLKSKSVVVATGGLSIPKMGATNFGYELAKKFGIKIVDTNPALVPLTFSDSLLSKCKELSGLSLDALVSHGKESFREGMLFTHRGLSGPSILQISSYWKLGDNISIDLAPNLDTFSFLIERKKSTPKQYISNIIAEIIPKRLSLSICAENGISGVISDYSNKVLEQLSEQINKWVVHPNGSEGYRTAEVTLGGIDTNELSSKTMMVKKHPGLYFVGELVDVTGHLGGHNFQWAWSSGFVAGVNA